MRHLGVFWGILLVLFGSSYLFADNNQESPGEHISRYEAASILVRALQLEDQEPESFTQKSAQEQYEIWVGILEKISVVGFQMRDAQEPLTQEEFEEIYMSLLKSQGIKLTRAALRYFRSLNQSPFVLREAFYDVLRDLPFFKEQPLFYQQLGGGTSDLFNTGGFDGFSGNPSTIRPLGQTDGFNPNEFENTNEDRLSDLANQGGVEETPLERARRLALEGSFASALLVYNELIDTETDLQTLGTLYWERALVNRALTNHEDAAFDANMALSLVPTVGTSQERTDIADSMFIASLSAATDSEKISLYEKALALGLSGNRNTSSIGEAYYNRGVTQANDGDKISDYELARSLGFTGTAQDAVFGQAYYNRGAGQGNDGDKISDYELARSLGFTGTGQDPVFGEAYYNRGAGQGNDGDKISDFELARSLGFTGTAQDAVFGEAYYNRGTTQADDNDKVSDYELARSLGFTGRTQDELFAQAYRQLGQYANALAIYDALIAASPTAHLYFQRGLTQIEAGNDSAAVLDAQLALDLDNTVGTTAERTTMGEAFYRVGLTQPTDNEKITFYELARSLGVISGANDAEYAQAYSNRADSKLNTDPNGARADYTSAIALDNTNAHAYYQRGILNHLRGDHLRAVLDYESAESLGFQGATQTTVAENRFAFSFYEVGRDQEVANNLVTARQRVEKAISIDPSKAMYHGELGKINLALGSFASSIENYTNAIARDTSGQYAQAYNNRRALAKQGLDQSDYSGVAVSSWGTYVRETIPGGNLAVASAAPAAMNSINQIVSSGQTLNDVLASYEVTSFKNVSLLLIGEDDAASDLAKLKNIFRQHHGDNSVTNNLAVVRGQLTQSLPSPALPNSQTQIQISGTVIANRVSGITREPILGTIQLQYDNSGLTQVLVRMYRLNETGGLNVWELWKESALAAVADIALDTPIHFSSLLNVSGTGETVTLQGSLFGDGGVSAAGALNLDNNTQGIFVGEAAAVEGIFVDASTTALDADNQIISFDAPIETFDNQTGSQIMLIQQKESPDRIVGIDDDAQFYDNTGYSYTRWGEWTAPEHFEPEATGAPKQFVLGYVTPLEEIPRQGTATYNGQLQGTYTPAVAGAREAVTGTSSLSVNFGTRAVNGSMTVNKNGSTWANGTVAGSLDTVNRNQFATTISGGGINSGDSWMNGQFYGPGSASTAPPEMGGGWRVSQSDGVATGVMVAKSA